MADCRKYSWWSSLTPSPHSLLLNKKPGFSVKGLEEHALQQLKAIAKKTSDSALILRQQEMARKAMQKAMHRDSLGTALQLNQKEENLKVEANPTPQ